MSQQIKASLESAESGQNIQKMSKIYRRAPLNASVSVRKFQYANVAHKRNLDNFMDKSVEIPPNNRKLTMDIAAADDMVRTQSPEPEPQ